MADDTRAAFLERARKRLAELWQASETEAADLSAVLPEIRNLISKSVNAETLSYRYVLLTQLLGKDLDAKLHTRACQAGCPLVVAWDARSLCHQVVVEFDRQNNSVLGGSPSPYLSKPLREHSIDVAFLPSKRNKAEYEDLIRVLSHAQDAPSEVPALLKAVIAAVRKRLAEVTIRYPVPNRSSFEASQKVVHDFLSERTGGVRLQAVAVALLRSLGERFGLFDTVRTANVNAADTQTGNVADLECIDAGGRIVLAVEVKDRELRLVDVQDKLPSIREHAVTESMFLITGEVSPVERDDIDAVFRNEFSSGQNLYVADWLAFLRVCLILFGEAGRRAFLKRIGEALDEGRLALSHRQRWRDLMTTI